MSGKGKQILLTGAWLMLLSVALGAFGAHGLQEVLAVGKAADWYELGNRYMFYHSLAVFGLGVLATAQPELIDYRRPYYFFIGGIILFTGSLIIMALTQQTWLGMVTPFGGLSFLAGWGNFIFMLRSVATAE